MRESCEPRCMSRPTRSTCASPAATSRHVDDIVVRNAELVSLAAGLDVVVRRVERDLGIHAKRHARRRPALARQLVDQAHFGFALGVDQENAGVERLRELAIRLADAAEDDVGRREPGAQRAMQLAAGHDVDAGAELAQHVAARRGSSSP